MKKTKKNIIIEYFSYVIIFLVGVLLVFLYKLNIDKTYNNLCDIAYQESEKEIKDSVNNLIMIIDSMRSYELSLYDEEFLDIERIKLIDEKIKSEIDEIIRNLDFYKNQYFWINEVLNYEGGDDYAIRRIHQNLIGTEGQYLSTNIKDINNKLPYQTELEGIVQNGEILQKYYFKNKVDDRIVEKLSYAKLYEPYNWIIATGIPFEDIYFQANLLKKKCKTFLPLVYFIDFCFVVGACLLLFMYKKKKEYKYNEQLAINENRFKSDFVANVTHDLRTPLNAIVGLTALIDDESLDKKELNDYISKIDSSTKFLLSLVDDILDISAMEEGKMVLNHDNFNIKDLIYPLINLFSFQSEKKGISFDCYCENIVYENLKGDISRLKQIISNLLANAIKFTNSGGFVNLIIRQEENNDDFLTLVINVIDSGCGIDKNQLDSIFNKFEQTSSTIKDTYGGSGIGLSIVKKLVSLMNGEVAVQSKLNKGSNFEIKLYFEYSIDDNTYNINDQNKKILFIDDKRACNLFSSICDEINIECKFENKIVTAIDNIKKANQNNKIYDYIIISTENNNLFLSDNIKNLLNLVDEKLTTILFTSYQYNKKTNYLGYPIFCKPIIKSTLVDLINEGIIKSESVNKSLKKNYDGLKILVVEDNKINQYVFKKILLSRNVEVDLADNGEQAYRIFIDKGDNYYDLIFMDYKMPILDGVKTTKLIRTTLFSYSKNVKIYAMTANTYSNDIDKFFSVGMDGYLSKPIEVKKIYNLLNEIYEKKFNI